MESPVTPEPVTPQPGTHQPVTPEQVSAREVEVDVDVDVDVASDAPVAEVTAEGDLPIDQSEQTEQVEQIEQVERIEAGERQMSFDEVEDSRVRAALDRLADLDGLPIAEQVEVFADIHARLADALGASATADADRDTSARS